MKVVFGSAKLRRCYEESARAFREWGREVGRRYIGRIEALYAMRDFSETFRQPSWRTHPLKGDREGQYAINLTGKWRLIASKGATETEIILKEVNNHYE